MNTQEREKLEQRAIKFSITGAAAFATIGLIYGVYTHSQSILFDGVYSCISLVMSMLTLWVSKLVVRPDDDRFQYGYTHLEPLLNVIKAVIISATCIYAMTEGISSLLDGGRVIDLSAAITYACISTFGSLLFGSVIYFYAKKVNSKLAKIDAIDWLFDCLLSSGILAGFLIAYLMQDSVMGEYIPYLDPVLVILLTTFFLPIPVKIFRDNIREVLLLAPSNELQQQLRDCVEQSIKSMGLEVCHLRMAKIGREFNLNVYVMVDETLDTDSVVSLDQIRQRIADALEKVDTDSSSMWLEVMFTNDERWVFE